LCRDPVHRKAFDTLLYVLENTLLPELSKAVGNEQILYGAADRIFQGRLPEVHEELKGMSYYFAKYCDVDMPSGKLAALQLIYQVAMPFIVGGQQQRDWADNDIFEEIAANFGLACTSLIVANSTGHVIHGRNLDWPSAPLYEPLTTQLTFTRGGEVVAVTTSFFPEIAPTSLVSANIGFSFNARSAEMQKDVQCLAKPGHAMDPFSLHIRQKVFEGVNFSTLYQELSEATFCAPAYIMISGPGEYEGALFTTHINEVPEVKNINTPYEDEGDPRKPWYVVVSNDDIEYSKAEGWSERYNLTLSLFEDLDQDEMASSIDNLEIDVLNISGVNRVNRTCYMCLMDTRNFDNGVYRTVVRSLTVSEDQFYQNETIPPEQDDSSASSGASSGASSTSVSESSGARLSYSSLMYVLFAVCLAVLSRI